ncbi:MAG: permease [Acidimicrobiales bacterium]
MFWDTAWALVLGFGLSGAVQAFVSRQSMQTKLGNHRPAAVARASGYGAISSSCSYAASAMAKSLFVKGADFVSSMVFMFASTNLVVELGIAVRGATGVHPGGQGLRAPRGFRLRWSPPPMPGPARREPAPV